MTDLDLRVVGGTVVDGTGSPAYRADIGIAGGRIVAVGDVTADATDTIDAAGQVVCPGFIDMHTHYDAQVLWDRRLSCSPWHGVTTVVIGSCGFGVAPMRPEHRDTILRTLEKVEGMSYEALAAGLGTDWPFVTYPEYLDGIESATTAVNVASYLGHTPLRLFVMGDEATERAATRREVEHMAELVRQAMAAGAVGLSTSMAATHHGAGGKPVPSRLADFTELDALVGAMAESGHGVLQAAMGRGLFNDEFEVLADRHGVPITWTALLTSMTGPGSHRRYLERAVAQQEAGRRIVPQVACRPISFDFHFAEPYPFEMLDCFAAIMTADTPTKREAYATPAFRAAFAAETVTGARNVNAGWWNRTVVSRFDPDPSLEERDVATLAAERGVSPVDLVLDLAEQSSLGARFRYAFLNHDEAEVRELITDPHTVVTLSDAGAHADQLCDACWSTHLLGHWVRDQGAMTLEAAVHELTARPARLMGLADRGTLEPGRAADLVVFDPDTVGASRPRRVADLPGGAERLVVDAAGVDAVVVNGTVLRRHDEDQVAPGAPLPGRLLRSS